MIRKFIIALGATAVVAAGPFSAGPATTWTSSSRVLSSSETSAANRAPARSGAPSPCVNGSTTTLGNSAAKAAFANANQASATAPTCRFKSLGTMFST